MWCSKIICYREVYFKKILSVKMENSAINSNADSSIPTMQQLDNNNRNTNFNNSRR